MPLFNQTAKRRAVNLSLNSDLIAKAQAQHLNLSAIAEAAIGAALARDAKSQFLADIAKGVAEHDAYLETYGSLADAVRAMGDPATDE